MSNQIRLKRGSGSNPSASDLVVGEVALRTDNGKLFTKKDDNSIAEIGTGLSDGDKGDITISNSGATFTIDNGVIDNANINASAAIAGTKVSPNFGSQNIVTTGTLGSADITITGTQPAVSFIDDGHNPDYKLYNNNGVLRLHDITNSSDRFVVNSSGKVGIGATNPSTFVEIKSQIPTLTLTDSTSKSWTSSDTTLAQLAFKTADPSGIGAHDVAFIQASNEVNSSSTPSAALVFGTSLSNNTASEKMRIKSDGNVAIGTTDFTTVGSPNRNLVVGSTTNAQEVATTLNVMEGTNNRRVKFFLDDDDGVFGVDSTASTGVAPFVVRMSTVEKLRVDTSGHLLIPNDTGKIKLGASQDLQIYHDGSNSIIEDNGTGGLILGVSGTGTSGFYKGTGQEPLATFEPDGAVSLYFNNSKKLETTTNGLEVTGSITVSGTVDGVDVAALSSTVSGKLSNVVEDTTPQLGGNLDCNNKVVTLNDSTGSDNNRFKIGNAGDLQIYHDGTNSFFQNHTTGSVFNRARQNWVLQTNATDGGADTAIQALQNGAVELYFDNSKKLETTTNGLEVTGSIFLGGKIDMGDSSSSTTGRILLGADDDLQIYHSSLNDFIQSSGAGFFIDTNNTLSLRKVTGENKAKFIGDGAVELYFDNDMHLSTSASGCFTNGSFSFRTDGNTEEILYDQANGKLRFNDNKKANFGSSDDLQIYHSGAASIVANTTGDLFLQDDGTVVVGKVTNAEVGIKVIGDGSVELYHDNVKKLETNVGGILLSDNLRMGDYHIELNDNAQIMLGNAPDSRIFHDGSNTYIHHSGTGDLIARIAKDNGLFRVYGNGNTSVANFKDNAEVELFYNGSQKFETTNTGISVSGSVVATGNMQINDNAILNIGNSGDLQLFHDTTNSAIKNNTGDLKIRSDSISLTDAAIGHQYFTGVAGGASKLFFDNSKKFETLSDGVNITGTLKVNGSAFSAGLSTSGGTLTGTLNARAILPTANNTYNLGSSSAKWANIFTNDLNLSNEGSANNVDGTWGSYTIQEGEESLFLINNRNGKMYKFLLQEVG